MGTVGLSDWKRSKQMSWGGGNKPYKKKSEMMICGSGDGTRFIEGRKKSICRLLQVINKQFKSRKHKGGSQEDEEWGDKEEFTAWGNGRKEDLPEIKGENPEDIKRTMRQQRNTAFHEILHKQLSV